MVQGSRLAPLSEISWDGDTNCSDTQRLKFFKLNRINAVSDRCIRISAHIHTRSTGVATRHNRPVSLL
nr:MAG TPA: hypothetical protein [Caudoviricetes sp.]